ncbi:hypothetical protein PP175_14285 [Aneurinibacillus sp. Ricciae_BoGa-3]|uniref:hypothetical protein n=1 Tax=Aneurinibacillus sp. Ricciae_BoGa-3 TaxID=3022697 RepID=UPI0023400229|nr:hypothetical protein [Aneurinibacillus sp. Ricciae_BoGa-3]WCK52602.1 hypothetical protein PP175_14285 [Aneurinibacillus sp. Ricciae_BoGa-3]
MENRFYHSLILPTTLAISLALSGCGAGSKSETGNSQPAASSGQMQPSQNANSNQAADLNSSQNNQAANTGQTNSKEKGQTPAMAEVVSQIKNKLEMKGAILPSSFPIGEGNHLTASIDRNGAQSYEVSFYQTKTPVPINDNSLTANGTLPVIAYFTATTYDDPNTVMNKMFAPLNINSGAQVVDLGHGIKGNAEGAAGHSYLSWREGNWILQIDSLLQDQMNNPGIARKMVDYLETHALPAPKDKGRIKVIYRPGGQDVSVGIYWQNKNKIYKLETNKVPLDALSMAVSVK